MQDINSLDELSDTSLVMNKVAMKVLVDKLEAAATADEFNRLKGARTGELLIEALQASPHRQIEIEPRRSAMPVRTVKL